MPPSPRRKLTGRHFGLLVAVLAVCGGIGLWAHDWWTVGRFLETTDDAFVGGNVTALAPEVSGYISKIAVDDNQSVHAGDLLIKLDDRDYRAALARTDAAVASAQAALTNLDATSRLQQAIIREAQAGTDAADAELDRARDDQARFQRLVAAHAVSIESTERADADYKQAVAQRERAVAALAAAQRQLDVIATQRLEAEAALAAAIAQRTTAQLNLDYTEIRAPIDGVVGNRSAQVGAYAAAGSQLIALSPARGLWMDCNFKENQLARLHPGSPAEIRVDALPGQRFRGHVVSVAPATGAQFSVLPPENATGNFTRIVQRVPVRIMLDDEALAHGQLRPGLSVTARVDTRSAEGESQ